MPVNIALNAVERFSSQETRRRIEKEVGGLAQSESGFHPSGSVADELASSRVEVLPEVFQVKSRLRGCFRYTYSFHSDVFQRHRTALCTVLL
jgi:hypothetical protein